MGGSLPELSHGLGEPGQDRRVVRDQAPKDAFNDIVLTFGYSESLEYASMEMWGSARKAARRRGRSKGYKAGCCRGWTLG